MTTERCFLYRDTRGAYRWRVQAANGEVIAASTEGYLSRQHARENYARIRGIGADDLEDLTDVEPAED